jgi:hypothetical protein
MLSATLRIRALLLFAAVAGITGCDTLNYAQYQIARAGANPVDRAHVVAAVNSAASRAALSDATSRSHVPDTLVYFEEPVGHFPTTLGARVVGDSIVVDLVCFHPGPGESKPFSAAKVSLSDSLRVEFGGRLTMLQNYRDRIPLEPVR